MIVRWHINAAQMSKVEAMAIKSRVVKRGSNLTTKIEKLFITIKAFSNNRRTRNPDI